MSESVPALDSFVTVLPVAPETRPRRGVLRFYGSTDFDDGLWAGVELVGEAGHNDGSVRGKRYFACAPGQGIFVRPQLLVPYADAAARATAEQLRLSRETELDLRVQLATITHELQRLTVTPPVTSTPPTCVDAAVQTEHTAPPAAEEERQQLREWCELLEEELRQERRQSDELTQLLTTATEEKTQLELRLQNVTEETQARLDEAQRQRFSLESTHTAHAQLQAHCDTLYGRIEQLQVDQAEELRRLRADHAQTEDELRVHVQTAERRARELQDEVAQLGARLVAAGVGATPVHDSLAAWERAQHAAHAARLQRCVVDLHTADLPDLTLWPECVLRTEKDGRVGWRRALQCMNARAHDPAHAAEQVVAQRACRATSRVLDFSTPDACTRSARQMFGIRPLA